MRPENRLFDRRSPDIIVIRLDVAVFWVVVAGLIMLVGSCVT